MRAPITALACVLLLACTNTPSTEADAGTQGPKFPPIASTQWGPFTDWASPIDDYLEVGQSEKPDQFNQGIDDLFAFNGRLWLGYGDGTYNLGEFIPIEFRAFASASDPAAQAAVVDGAGQGAEQTTPTQSGEEELARYRLCDGALWHAGVDSIDADELHTQMTTTPKSIQGNVYRLEGDKWLKRRTITGGEHVHDVAAWKGAIYAVGSGADTRMEFEGGQVFRYLWRSDDRGESFSTVTRVQYPTAGKGDTRFIHLLPLGDALVIFGYEAAFAGGGVIRNASWDGSTVTDLMGRPLGPIYPDGTQALPDGSGVVWGLNLSRSTRRLEAWHVSAALERTPLASLAGKTVLDVSLREDTSELLYLTIDGDDPDAEAPAMFDVRLFAASAATPDATTELQHFATATRPMSVAWFDGALFLGTRDGKVLKASLAN